MTVLTSRPRSPTLLAVVPSGGSAPKSVTEHDGLVYVLNTGDAFARRVPALPASGLEPIDGSRRELGRRRRPRAGRLHARRIRARRHGPRRERASSSTPSAPTGSLGEPQPTASAGPTPYGFAFAGGDTLVVTEAFGAAKGKAAASSYRLDGGSAAAVTESVGNGRSEICWAVPRPTAATSSRRTSPTAPCRATASRPAASSCSRTRPLARRSTASRASATRTSAATAASSTPSMPTAGACSAGGRRRTARAARLVERPAATVAGLAAS